MKTEQSLEQLKTDIAKAITEHRHDKRGDGIRFNFGTAFILFATASATLIPTEPIWLLWCAKVLTGFAALWVALERALNFGARWRYHIEMQSSYQSILDELNFMSLLDERDRNETLQNIRAELRVLRKRASEIPGVNRM